MEENRPSVKVIDDRGNQVGDIIYDGDIGTYETIELPPFDQP